MTIPIDPSQLPPDVPASNVFAVGLVDNDWVRLRGKVDTNDNTITVSTLINGVYSWGYSTAPNLGGNPRNYLDTLTSQASTLADAQAAAAARQDEFSSRWDGCQFTVQPFSGQPPAGESSPALGENGQHTVILRPKDAASKGLAGDPAALMIGDVPVGHYGGATIGGSAGNLTVSELSTDNLLQVRCLLLSLESYARLEEANAVVDAMAKPEQTDFFPDDSGLITDWVGLQSETNPDGSLPPDWTTSPFVDETVDQAVLGGGDVRVTLTWGNTADLDLAVTDPEGNQIYYGSTSSSTGGQLDVDANGYCTEPLTTSPVENIFWSEGSAPTGEYLVQVAYSIECQGEGSTAYTVLIINGSDVQTYQGMVGEGDLTDVATFER
jgi:hypothetical protein